MKRIWEHREKKIDGFTKKYNVWKLVYFEETTDVNAAIHKEKLIKKWKRVYKFDAIEKMNPEWRDLYEDWIQPVAGDPATSAG